MRQELLQLSNTNCRLQSRKAKMMTIKSAIQLTAALSVALAIAGCKEAASSAAPGMPPSVPVAEVVVRPVTPFLEFTGSLTAVKRVELRPRVAGYIQKVSVPEGRFVEKGSELFLIDPRVAQAALSAATARLREAEAASSLAEAEHARAEQLFAQKIVARDRLDIATASLTARKAQVDAAKAAVGAAQLDLSFTRVTAPISGRVGQTLVTEGNYVASGETPLTTIVSINPLHVYFDVDERTYLRSLAAGRDNAAPQGTQAAKVMVALLNDKTYSRPGRVDFLSNTSDRGTGTVRVRAVVENPDGHLTPGLFAKVKLETGAAQAKVLISDQSIGTDQGSRYVFVVGQDDKTEYRPVELGPMVDGLRVIEQGLQPGERIVVKGLVRPGMQVTPQSAAIDGVPIAAPQTVRAAQ
jgi:gold/copper resistance efflux system membrane fusion protein